MFILLFLVTMIFALLGMQIFGGQFNEAHGYGEEDEGFAPLPRYHFDYFVPAMLTCFIVTTGAWYAPMLEGVNVIGPGAVFFFLVVVIIGTYVMMNLLVVHYCFSSLPPEVMMRQKSLKSNPRSDRARALLIRSPPVLDRAWDRVLRQCLSKTAKALASALRKQKTGGEFALATRKIFRT